MSKLLLSHKSKEIKSDGDHSIGTWRTYGGYKNMLDSPMELTTECTHKTRGLSFIELRTDGVSAIRNVSAVCIPSYGVTFISPKTQGLYNVFQHMISSNCFTIVSHDIAP